MIITSEAGRSTIVRSFRDPAGVLFQQDRRILRAVNSEAVADLEAFLQTRTAREAMRSGKLVHSVRISGGDAPDLMSDPASQTGYLLEHERIWFPSYPYEWPPEMLYAAGVLTLELARQALEEDFGLKDATPYNILFRGGQPIFVDVLSFERRNSRDQFWMAYGQFVRTFLLPLLANRDFGMPLEGVLTTNRDGLEPEMIYRCAGPIQRLKPSFLSLVTLPKWLGTGASPQPQKLASSVEQAQFVLRGLFKSCERHLERLEPPEGARQSRWSQYLDSKSLYTPAQFGEKEAFVAEALRLTQPRTVLDVGANEGHFSFLAADAGSSVVAIDSDPVVTGSIWRHASRARLDVLPMVVDLTRPTPAIGWRNQECASFLDRARGAFDLVMMLAVVHHMLITERIPLDDLLALAGELSRDYVLIEFVAPEDPMFRQLVHGRENLYSHLSNAWFEAAAAPRFELVRSAQIDGLHRWLYLFRQRHTAS